MKKNIKITLFLLILPIISMQNKRDVTLEDHSHPWAHHATQKSLQIGLHWLAEEVSASPRQWADEKFSDHFQLLKPLLLTLNKKGNEVAKDTFAKGLSNITADSLWGTPQEDDIPSHVLPFIEDEITINHLSFGCEHFCTIYTEQRKIFERKLETTQELKNLCTFLGTQALIAGTQQATSSSREAIIHAGCEKGLPQALHYPLDYSMKLAQESVLTHLVINPLDTAISKKIVEYYEKQLVRETAEICACHGCIAEVLENLPENHLWHEILEPIQERFLKDEKCCAFHKKDKK